MKISKIFEPHKVPLPQGYRWCTACNGYAVDTNGDECKDCAGLGVVPKNREPHQRQQHHEGGQR